MDPEHRNPRPGTAEAGQGRELANYGGAGRNPSVRSPRQGDLAAVEWAQGRSAAAGARRALGTCGAQARGQMGSSDSHRGAGSGTAGNVTGPLTSADASVRMLPGQIARFGELAGRHLSARAFAMLRARAAGDPQRHGDAQDFQPLTSEEQLEMVTLRAAISGEGNPAIPASPADTTRPEPECPPKPAQLPEGPADLPGTPSRICPNP